METIQATLTFNKTFPYARWVTWQRLTIPGHPCCGVLQIDEQKKCNGKLRTRRYAVREIVNEYDDTGRTFLLTKPLSESDEDKKHSVYLNPTAKPDEVSYKCTCKWGQKNELCAHVEALQKLAAVGALPTAA